jgi:hypothetical protein
MAAKGAKKRARGTSDSQRARTAMSREAEAAYGEIQKGVKQLGESIADIRRDLRTAERKIETDARGRIRELRTEARAQLRVLQLKQAEAGRNLRNLSAAVGES